MKFSKFQISLFTLLKLPSVWLCGIRVTSLEQSFCEAKVKHRWINQNPFKSMFWAVQGMAAELTTGMLLMQEIQISKRKVSMLVLNNIANFSKKAQGRITFSCNSSTFLKIKPLVVKASTFTPLALSNKVFMVSSLSSL